MKRFQKIKFLFAALLATLMLNPNVSQACSACYGDPSSTMSKGLRWGIFVLLSVVVMVLGCITTFFVYIAKKSSTDTDTPTDSTDKV
ncbi:MAG: hypothetical protein QOD03_1044 [Verrucomicrobiota bacterium]|jgi:heme/copper-type cytochrome/quinol oxidase subunit 2